MSEYIKIIGIDCATEAKNTGLSLGLYSNGVIELKEITTGSRDNLIAQIINKWINPNEKVLLAIDAPLGWPINLGQALYVHDAGKGISIDSNILFRRETDRFIKRNLGKQPLDVGADRIARTAHAALRILDDLRLVTGKPIELAWQSQSLVGISAIEVYPAATLECYGIKNTSYKNKTQQAIRKMIIKELKRYVAIPENLEIINENADALDSAICLLAAKDFIKGNVYYPENMPLAEKEGWIWVKNV